MKAFRVILVLFFVVKGLLCLRDVHVSVPEAVERWAPVKMMCMFDLEQEQLYSVKWYRGDREFYRYTPADDPPIKIFMIPGIDVDTTESDEHRLSVVHATTIGQGKYTCEVTADAPSFQAAQDHRFMYVVDLPKSGPEIYGTPVKHRVGTKLRADCVLKGSLPAANLSFFINDEPVTTQQIWNKVEVDEEYLMTTVSTIQFVVQKHNFIEKRLMIKCAAYIYSIYYKTAAKCILEEEENVKPTEDPTPFKPVRINRAKKKNKTIKAAPSSARVITASFLNIAPMFMYISR